MTIKFDTDTIRKINVFEEITGVEVRDCMVDDNSAHFVVNEDEVGLAIGKGGATIKRVQRNLDQDIRVYGYSDDIETFVDNMVPADINSVEITEEDDEKIAVIKVDRRNRSRVVGRNGRNVDVVKRFLKKSFGIDDVRVE